MKKTFFAILISIASFGALANGYCNGKPTQVERDNCYRVMNSTGNANPMNGMRLQMAKEIYDRNHNLVKTTPKLNEQQRSSLLTQFVQFDKNRAGNCGSDMECMTQRYIKFNDKTKAQYQRYTAK